MVPLCYRSATVNGPKKPACILHASYCDVQDANEMRTVENAKQNETYETDTRDIRDTYGTIDGSRHLTTTHYITLPYLHKEYISCDFCEIIVRSANFSRHSLSLCQDEFLTGTQHSRISSHSIIGSDW